MNRSNTGLIIFIFLLFVHILFLGCKTKNEPSSGIRTDTDISLRDTISITDTIVIRDTITKWINPLSVKADKMNVLYKGVDNPITISGNPEMVSISDGGNLKKVNENKYTAFVLKPGKVTIDLMTNDQTSSFPFRVKFIPDPVARLSNSTSGNMSALEFKAQGGLASVLENFDFDIQCKIAGFNLIYMAKRADPVETQNRGPKYSPHSRRLINLAKPGDIYIFENVRAKCSGDPATRKINSLFFIIR